MTETVQRKKRVSPQVQELRDLAQAFEAFCLEKCPYSYRDGKRAQHLREEMARLFGDTAPPAVEEEEAAK